MKRWFVILVGLYLVAAACTPGGGGEAPATINPSGSHRPVTITLWSPYTSRELKDYDEVLAMFHQQYPWITVDHVGGKHPSAILQAINAGNPPDVALEFGPDAVAKYCASGAWIDLNPYIELDKMDISSIVPPAALRFTSYQNVQCALPALSDAYGLYYNTDMFKAAGIASPPKTFSEFEADMKKLTQFNPDGSIKVAGFVPLHSFYETYALDYGDYNGARWYDDNGHASFATDPKWSQLLEWQKSLVDWYGYDNLQRFVAEIGGANSEWTTEQAFEQGRVAMALDGEWRVAFIQNDHSDVPYATAPFPVSDDDPSLYGAGQIGGDVIGIPRGSPHEAEAWLLVKWLATDTQAEVALSERLKNVPTTFDSLQDPTLTSDPHFDTFLKIFGNPRSGYKPLTTIGTGDETTWENFVDKYLAGNVPDLHAGLEQVDQQIDNLTSLG